MKQIITFIRGSWLSSHVHSSLIVISPPFCFVNFPSVIRSVSAPHGSFVKNLIFFSRSLCCSPSIDIAVSVSFSLSLTRRDSSWSLLVSVHRFIFCLSLVFIFKFDSSSSQIFEKLPIYAPEKWWTGWRLIFFEFKGKATDLISLCNLWCSEASCFLKKYMCLCLFGSKQFLTCLVNFLLCLKLWSTFALISIQ